MMHRSWCSKDSGSEPGGGSRGDVIEATVTTIRGISAHDENRRNASQRAFCRKLGNPVVVDDQDRRLRCGPGRIRSGLPGAGSRAAPSRSSPWKQAR